MAAEALATRLSDDPDNPILLVLAIWLGCDRSRNSFGRAVLSAGWTQVSELPGSLLLAVMLRKIVLFGDSRSVDLYDSRYCPVYLVSGKGYYPRRATTRRG